MAAASAEATTVPNDDSKSDHIFEAETLHNTVNYRTIDEQTCFHKDEVSALSNNQDIPVKLV